MARKKMGIRRREYFFGLLFYTLHLPFPTALIYVVYIPITFTFAPQSVISEVDTGTSNPITLFYSLEDDSTPTNSVSPPTDPRKEQRKLLLYYV